MPKFHKKLQIANKYTSNSGLKLLRSSNKAFTINYFFENGEKVQISLDLPSEHTVSQSILAMIRAINSQLPAGAVLLKSDPKIYNLHFTKKNGKAKDDLPGIDLFFKFESHSILNSFRYGFMHWRSWSICVLPQGKRRIFIG